MFLFSFDTVPIRSDIQVKGALIQCWVNFKDFRGSEFLARKYIESLGWKIISEEYPAAIVSRTMFPLRAKDKTHNLCFNLAVRNGISHLCITYQSEE